MDVLIIALWVFRSLNMLYLLTFGTIWFIILYRLPNLHNFLCYADPGKRNLKLNEYTYRVWFGFLELDRRSEGSYGPKALNLPTLYDMDMKYAKKGQLLSRRIFWNVHALSIISSTPMIQLSKLKNSFWIGNRAERSQ